MMDYRPRRREEKDYDHTSTLRHRPRRAGGLPNWSLLWARWSYSRGHPTSGPGPKYHRGAQPAGKNPHTNRV